MDILLADIGGTNTRLALADASGLIAQTRDRRPNADWNSFEEMLGAYLRERGAPRIRICCIAIAGPVRGRAGRLTNRDWHIDAEAVARASGAPRAELLNDLCALGHALPDLVPTPVCEGAGALRNGQSLVVGIGTGFNVCPTRREGAAAAALESEAGHADLPAPVRDLLRAELGGAAEGFRTVEDCFCGRGAAAIARAVAGADLAEDQAMRALCAQDGPNAGRAGRIFAEALGLLARSLICQHLPRDGVVFAGGVARGVLGSAATAAFREAFRRDGMDVVDPRDFPVSVIKDDAAALLGCLRRARAIRDS